MAATVDMARRFAGCSGDDTLLTACLSAAKSWYAENDVPEINDPQYDFWVCNLAAWMYDHRGDSDAMLPHPIVTSVHQLRQIAARTEA